MKPKLSAQMGQCEQDEFYSKRKRRSRPVLWIAFTAMLIALATLVYTVLHPNTGTVINIVLPESSQDNKFQLSLGTERLFTYKTESKSRFKNPVSKHALMDCSVPSDLARFDCFPEYGASEAGCLARGCCWKPPAQQGSGAPACYYPKDFSSYAVTSSNKTDLGYVYHLKRYNKTSWPNETMDLTLEVSFETQTRLHIKIYDSSQPRYEVPFISRPLVGKPPNVTDYNVKVIANPFSISVIRRKTGKVIFSSTNAAPLIFADQFIQFSAVLSSSRLYGLGEHEGPLMKNMTFRQLAFWARDVPPTLNTNLYGSHPFYLNSEDSGDFNGVFLLNSNAMSVTLQPTPAITYRTTGGVLDFYLFTGPLGENVVQQYTQVVGTPYMPPYWSLGFHLCKWGYGSVDNVKEVIQRTRDGGFPYDVQWNDIDYMDKFLDWTYDKKSYAGLPDMVKDLHDNGQHYVMIVDPGISNQQKAGAYPPYDDGLKQNVFIMEEDGSGPLIGQVWPGTTAYPDFTHPNVTQWWSTQAKSLHDQVPFDGLWTDMNEPSNFIEGSAKGCSKNILNNPPYVPRILDGKLYSKTVCPSAKQFLSTHYNLHNLYGFSEVIATSKALINIRSGKRSLIISRSSFPGIGHYGGHWSGDNLASWDDLHYSIPFILNFNMFGVSQVGADICGFRGNTTEELCTRWMQLGAFYPFMRNHNSINQMDQDPAVFGTEAQDAIRSVLQMRYRLLPFLYTLFYKSHVDGRPIVRPLSFQYPDIPAAQSIDTQFMWWDALLISPVLQEGKTSISAFFPKDDWYDFYTGAHIAGDNQWWDLEAPFDKINVHIKSGSIFATQEVANTTTASRKLPFHLLMALSWLPGLCNGELFWDDGESLDSIVKEQFNLISFTGYDRMISSSVLKLGYNTVQMPMSTVTVLGVKQKPDSVVINKAQNLQFTYNAELYVLHVDTNMWDLRKPFNITF